MSYLALSGGRVAERREVFSRGATFVNPAGLVLPVNDVPIVIPWTCAITSVTIITTGGTGSCVIDIRRSSYANYPPTAADSICGAAKPTITAGIRYQDSTLSGWVTSVAAGDILIFHLESVSGALTLIDISLTFSGN